MSDVSFKIGDEAFNEIWGPTMQLRINRIVFSGREMLQQKWIERQTGKEEWRDIEVVNS